MAESPIFGLLNIDKPAGMTSHDVVDWLRKQIGLQKIGHAGTLDPAATGVLVLCLGSATRLSEYIMGHTKTYLATIRLGQNTDTYDAEGEIISSDDTPVEQAAFEAALSTFKGHIKQVPPMYSALKQGGEKLYEKARRGEEVEREARDVIMYKLNVESFVYPEAMVLVRCSPGTYIRSLAYDVGASLGVGAHLQSLRRLASGENFTVDNAITLEALEAAIKEGTWREHLISVRLGLSDMPYIELNNDQEARVRNGQAIKLGISNRSLIQAWTDEGLFVAVMSRNPDESDDEQADWKPIKVFNNSESEE